LKLTYWQEFWLYAFLTSLLPIIAVVVFMGVR
jgi:hypothetical protein